jgi:hypothetical protein
MPARGKFKQTEKPENPVIMKFLFQTKIYIELYL